MVVLVYKLKIYFGSIHGREFQKCSRYCLLSSTTAVDEERKHTIPERSTEKFPHPFV
jgi:hypothetical protein